MQNGYVLMGLAKPLSQMHLHMQPGHNIVNKQIRAALFIYLFHNNRFIIDKESWSKQGTEELDGFFEFPT